MDELNEPAMYRGAKERIIRGLYVLLEEFSVK